MKMKIKIKERMFTKQKSYARSQGTNLRKRAKRLGRVDDRRAGRRLRMPATWEVRGSSEVLPEYNTWNAIERR